MVIKMHFQNLKFKEKLWITYILIGILPILIWGIFSYQQTNYFLSLQARDSMERFSGNIFQAMENNLKKCADDFRYASNNQRIGDIINTEYDSAFAKYYDVTVQYDTQIDTICNLNGAISDVLVFAEGDLKNTRNSFLGTDEMPRWLKESLPGTPALVWHTDEQFLYIAQRVPYENSYEKLGVLMFQYDLSGVFPESLFSGMDETMRLTIYNAKKQEILQKGSIPGVQSDALEHSFSENGWTVTAEYDAAASSVAPFPIVLAMLLVLTVSVALMVLMVSLFASGLNRRIQILGLQLSAVVKSGFETKISSPYHDEIGEITNRVGDVIDEIKDKVDALYESWLIQRDAEIKALQSQINLHFLYNTLSSVNWAAIRSGNMEISRVVGALSTFYRSMLNKGNGITSVQSELQNIRAYLDIQLFTHRNSFDVFYEITPLVEQYSIPCLILQPLVENAIEHGTDLKREGRGSILICIGQEADQIIFEVQDNGKGMSPTEIEEILVKNVKGYGVKNIDHRLRLYFGRQYTLSVESHQGLGTKVTIKIPKWIYHAGEK